MKKYSLKMFFPRILNKSQLDIFDKLELPTSEKFYLAGGTALALQIGHRTSVDFDFYTQTHFKTGELTQLIYNKFPKLRIDFEERDTLRLSINEIELSFFYYSYKLVKPLLRFEKMEMASKEDIAAMKIAAIIQRGVKRDFVDIYYLLTEFSLGQIVGFAIKKYPGYQEALILKALIYFNDADVEKRKRPVEIFDKNFSWEKAKEKIFQEVKKYQLAMIKN